MYERRVLTAFSRGSRLTVPHAVSVLPVPGCSTRPRLRPSVVTCARRLPESTRRQPSPASIRYRRTRRQRPDRCFIASYGSRRRRNDFSVHLIVGSQLRDVWNLLTTLDANIQLVSLWNIGVFNLLWLSTLKPKSNSPLYSNTVIGTLAVDAGADPELFARGVGESLSLPPSSPSLLCFPLPSFRSSPPLKSSYGVWGAL